MATNASIKINGGTGGQAATHLELGSTVNLSNDNAGGELTYEWTIVSQPAGTPGAVFVNSGDIVSEIPAPQFVITKEGSYLIRLIVNQNLPDEKVATTICAVRELQTGNRIPAAQETTEVDADEGWALDAVNDILQRVTRLTDSGIFVAQASEPITPGDVVHMRALVDIADGLPGERKVPSVEIASAATSAEVDGPLGIMVGNVAGQENSVTTGQLCRVMVIGALSSYAMDDGPEGAGEAGDPVFVGNDGHISLTAGTWVRQVGDVASVVSPGIYDIAISAGANSIPRGNAGGDLEGSTYPDPTISKLQGATLSSGPTPDAWDVLVFDSGAWQSAKAFLGRSSPTVYENGSIVGTLKPENGGTGSALPSFVQGGVVFAETTTSMNVTATAPDGYFLISSGPGGTPTWTGTVSVARGGTGLNGPYTTGAMLYANGATSLTYLEPTAAGTRGILQSKGDGAAPVWIANGTSGYPLVSKGPSTDAAFEQLNLATAVTGTLPVNRGGTGQANNLNANGVVYANSVTTMASTSPGTAGQFLKSNGGLAPTFSAIDLSNTASTTNALLISRGGTGSALGAMSAGGIVYANGTSTMGVSAAGSVGQLLTSQGYLDATPLWVSFPDYYGDIYAGTFTASTASYSTTGGAYSTIVAVGPCDLEVGNITVSVVPIADALALSNTITTASNGASTTVSLKYMVVGPAGFGTKNYLYAFRSSTAHNNNQVTGSITFPVLTFYATHQGDYTVTLQATVTSSDTFQVFNLAMRVTQG